MKTYRLESSLAFRTQWIIPIIFGAVFATVALVAGENGPPLPFVLLPFSIGVGFLVWLLRLPNRIEVREDGSMEWIAPIRRILVTACDVVSIAPDRNGNGFFILTHSSGRFRFMNQFTGFHELLAELKKANPAVELRGC